ncbi:HNH endonuclease [Paenibacillus filicis]|uniref:HNH endonuclease n=1 Tax=Paenibacillus filicis TaxID=669464 RepID=A0ABU9DK36_9BACL
MRGNDEVDHLEYELHNDIHEQPTEGTAPAYKQCAHCKEDKPLSEFLRRSGRRGGKSARRGACRSCRKLRKLEGTLTEAEFDEPADIALIHANGQHDLSEPKHPGRPVSDPAELESGTPGEADAQADAASLGEAPRKKRRRRRRRKKPAAAIALTAADSGEEAPPPPPPPKIRVKRPLPLPPPRPKGPDASVLRPNSNGVLWMRGRTDKGRRWQQETDLETAVNLVREHAAIVVNKHTIRRIYSNKTFRLFILTRDRYTCHFCGEYGDTLDHIVPRAKGGHTTPVNCVCACNECNQLKADQNWEDFIDTDPSFLRDENQLAAQDIPDGPGEA